MRDNVSKGCTWICSAWFHILALPCVSSNGWNGLFNDSKTFAFYHSWLSWLVMCHKGMPKIEESKNQKKTNAASITTTKNALARHRTETRGGQTTTFVQVRRTLLFASTWNEIPRLWYALQYQRWCLARGAKTSSYLNAQQSFFVQQVDSKSRTTQTIETQRRIYTKDERLFVFMFLLFFFFLIFFITIHNRWYRCFVTRPACLGTKNARTLLDR